MSSRKKFFPAAQDLFLIGVAAAGVPPAGLDVQIVHGGRRGGRFQNV